MKKNKIISCIITGTVTLFFVMAVFGAIVISVSAVYCTKLMNTTETISIERKTIKTPTRIFQLNEEKGKYELIYKRDGNSSDIQLEVNLADLPEYVGASFIAVEDERFYEHSGVDYRRTAAALANEVLNFYGETHGGSTITQQLIKNITNDNETTWERKIREIFRAIKVERKYTKNEILEAYLNTIYFGQDAEGENMYGIESAAIGYFAKNASDLTLAEAASLAAVPHNPYYENPVSNYEKNQERKEYVLRKLFQLGKISSDDYENALKQKVEVRSAEEAAAVMAVKPEYELFDNPAINSWVVDTAIYEFRQYLQESTGCSESRALELFGQGGYDIYLTVDADMQEYLEEKYLDYTFFPSETNEQGEKIQSAFVVMDYSGQILAVVGGIGEKPGSLCWNNATMTRRQPGSTIKPVSTYGYGIENNFITWSSMFVDAPLQPENPEGELWPENYTNFWSYKSNTVSYFLKKSINTVPAQLCRDFGAEPVFRFATEKMHLDLDPQYDIDLAPMSVGATSQGPTLVNLTNSYLPFGNGGKYYQAHIISRIVDSSDNKIIFEHGKDEYVQTIGADTAFIMNKLLQNVVNPDQADGEPGTGVAAYLPDKTVAGKTGTTQNWRDIDFIGMTEDFVSGIWIGYSNGENADALMNTRAAAVWRNVFGDYANSYRQGASYPECSYVKEAYYCTETGLLANANCPHSAEPGYYKISTCRYCNKH